FGQYCVVMPEQDAVLAITGGLGDMQPVLSLAWEHLLPALGAEPLPDDAAAHAKLRRKLARLALSVPQGQHTSPLSAEVLVLVYALEPNDRQLETVALDFGDGCLCRIQSPGGEQRIGCGSGAWLAGSTTFDDGELRPAAAGGAWTSENTYTIKLC